MNVRPYKSGDYQGLLLFLRGAFNEIGNGFLLDGKDADVRDIEHIYRGDRASFYVIDDQGEIHGCIGLRKFSDEIAELKRLYIAREYRGLGLGRTLCVRAIKDARDFGYKYLRLDTTRKSQAAAALFKQLEFYEIERYNSDPFAEIFMEMTL